MSETARCQCCGGNLKAGVTTGYSKCDSCGTYKSDPALQQELYKEDYWTHDQKRSTPDEQDWNLRDRATTWRSRLDMWMSAVWNVRVGRSFEIGYMPGTLQKAMAERGWTVYGCDPSAGDEFFVGDNGWRGDLVLAMDVLEHFPDVVTCLKGMAAMAPVVIVQTPCLMHDGYPMEPRMWIAGEHVHVFTLKGMQALAAKCGLEIVGIDIWMPGHELFIMRRK
jgi:hypothetical protein